MPFTFPTGEKSKSTGSFQECVNANKDKDSPGGFCKSIEELQSKLNTARLNKKLAQLPKRNLSLQEDNKNKKTNKLDELKNRLLSQKLQVGSSSSFRFASLDTDTDEFVSYFLIKGDVVNGRDWGVTNDSIPQNIHTFKGMPFVVTSNEFIANSIYGATFDHPNVIDAPKIGLAREGSVDINNLDLIKAFQDRFRVGTIEDVIKVGDSWRAIIKKDKEFIGRQFPPFCSPAIFKNNSLEPEDGITNWNGLHLAGLIDRPAYGNIALYKGSCTGTIESCKPQFRHASKAPCVMMKLKGALAIHAIKNAVLISPSNPDTKVQNVFRDRTKDPCPQGTTNVNGTCIIKNSSAKRKKI